MKPNAEKAAARAPDDDETAAGDSDRRRRPTADQRVSGIAAVGDPIPYVLTKEQLAAVLCCSCRQIDRFRRLRNHRGVVELDQPGQVRFSGRALKRWLDETEPEAAPVAHRRSFLTHHRARSKR